MESTVTCSFNWTCSRWCLINCRRGAGTPAWFHSLVCFSVGKELTSGSSTLNKLIALVYWPLHWCLCLVTDTVQNPVLLCLSIPSPVWWDLCKACYASLEPFFPLVLIGTQGLEACASPRWSPLLDLTYHLLLWQALPPKVLCTVIGVRAYG